MESGPATLPDRESIPRRCKRLESMDHIPERDRFVNAGSSKHNNPVDVIGHDNEGVEGNPRVVLWKLAPDARYHLAGRIQLHLPGYDIAK